MATQVRKRNHGTYTMGRELLCNSGKDHPKPLLLMELVRLWLPQRNKHGLCMFVGLKERPWFMPRWRLRAERHGPSRRASPFFLFVYPSTPAFPDPPGKND